MNEEQKESHLIIGLGGTGAKIIREFRKIMHQQEAGKTTSAVVDYLYVDSSDQEMGPDNEDWKIHGTSIQLSKSQQLLITEGDLPSRLDNVNHYPGIKPWIGDRNLWMPYLRTIQGTKAAAGQRRRLGRFLCACNVQHLNEMIALQVNALYRRGQTTNVTFHICCGLAGGTGSGSIVDTVAQIRAAYPAKKDRIIIYALLPEKNPKPTWSLSGYYHANGYAALMELNALSAGRWDPHDLTGQKDRLQLSDPFNACYVFTNENENGVPVDVDTEIPSIVADFLFQKIVAVEQSNWGELSRMENAENGDSKSETNGTSTRGERSKRFMTFGIKRLAYPEGEIEEFLAHAFARQACLQLQFNNWMDESGYIPETNKGSLDEQLRQKEKLEHWRITDGHLSLSLGILPEEVASQKWKTIEEDWHNVMPHLKQAAWESAEENKLDALDKLCFKRFNVDYRGSGVQNFYNAKMESRRDYAKAIRRTMEDDFFADWRNGILSVSQITELLGKIKKYLEERAGNFGKRVAEAREAVEREDANIKARQKEWPRVGLVSGLLGKRQKLFHAQATHFEDLYVAKSQIEGCTFAQKLVAELISELESLEYQVGKCSSLIGDFATAYEKSLNTRCNDPSEQIEYKRHLIKFYQPDLVQKICKVLIRDKGVQKIQTSAIRDKISQRLGQNPTFGLFNERINQSSLKEILEENCLESAKTAHDNGIKGQFEKILKVNIIDKLKEHYADNHQLHLFVSNLMKHAGNFAIFDEAEERNMEAKNGPICISSCSVIVPKTSDPFMARLKEAFRQSTGSEISFVETSNSKRSNEICIVSLKNLVPLRTLEAVKFLRGRYQLAVSGTNPQEARMFLHLEGDGSGLPSLFAPLARELREDCAPYLLIAKTLGVLQESKSKTLGGTALFFVQEDKHGLEVDQIELGATLIDAVEKLDFAKFEKLQQVVEQKLSAGNGQNAQKIPAIVAEVKAIKVLRGNDPADPTYILFNNAAKRAVARLEQI